MKVILSAKARVDLAEIWNWNAQDKGIRHADSYLFYLKKHIQELAERYALGKTVHTNPDNRYIIIKRNSKGHGHIVVYSFDNETVSILHIFHTSQNWEAELSD